MARRLTQYPERIVERSTYPWAEWADGSAWQIERGEDFDLETEKMRGYLHTRASQTRCKVRTTISGDTITFQFYGFQKEPKKKRPRKSALSTNL